MLWIYLLGYGIGRFWIESLRTDQLILFGTGLSGISGALPGPDPGGSRKPDLERISAQTENLTATKP